MIKLDEQVSVVNKTANLQKFDCWSTKIFLDGKTKFSNMIPETVSLQTHLKIISEEAQQAEASWSKQQ
jgi:hypothetical protein